MVKLKESNHKDTADQNTYHHLGDLSSKKILQLGTLRQLAVANYLDSHLTPRNRIQGVKQTTHVRFVFTVTLGTKLSGQ